MLLLNLLDDLVERFDDLVFDLLSLLAATAEPYERIVIMFDGNDEAELNDARAQWKALKEAGATLAYYQQTENGGWEKKA